MKILNKQKLEKEISSLFKQLESEGSAQLNAERFNAGLTQIFEKSELTLSGGDSKLVSVLFADLRGFTSMVEKISSADITTILNEFFSTMVEIIDKHGGHINKFMGDSIFAFFEDTKGAKTSVLNILQCAIEMQIAMDKVNQKSEELGIDTLYMGIGVDTGSVISSVLGSSIYREFTMIGPTVNLASRIEGYTLRGQVLISENTRKHAGIFFETGIENEVSAKGMKQPIRIYELLSIKFPENLQVPIRDNRKAPRIEINIPVSYQLLDGKSVLPEVLEGHIVDISYGGVMISAPEYMNKFSNIKMDIKLSPLSTVQEIYAKALYVQNKGDVTEIGMAFTIIDDSTSAAIKSFVDNLV